MMVTSVQPAALNTHMLQKIEQRRSAIRAGWTEEERRRRAQLAAAQMQWLRTLVAHNLVD
jgi:hypothetical protein